MEIAAFQFVIMISMAIAKAISTKALGYLTVGWTIFTLLMVFTTPLIFLQLAVVWLAYSYLKPKEAQNVDWATSNIEAQAKSESGTSLDETIRPMCKEVKATTASVYRAMLAKEETGRLRTIGLFDEIPPTTKRQHPEENTGSPSNCGPDLGFLSAQADDWLKMIDARKDNRGMTDQASSLNSQADHQSARSS